MTDPTADNLIVLGQGLSRDGELEGYVGIPAHTLDRHLLITGKTGTGKSTVAIHALLCAHNQTEGCTIAIDPKGDWSEHLLRAQYARDGSFEDVYYFDSNECVPAISFFDVRQDMDIGRDRYRAVQNIVDHFLDIVDPLTPDDHEAIRAPDIIRYLSIALFDPETGTDAYAIDDLLTAVHDLRAEQTVPEVSVPWSDQLLSGLTATNPRRLEQVAGGSTTRVEKIYGSGYLRPMFQHVPDDPAAAFRFDTFLNEDTLLVFDLGALTEQGQTVVANTVLSLLWRALQRRKTATSHEHHPLVTLAIDEIPQLNIEPRLAQLLSLGRGYGLGVIPILQHPAQLHSETGANDAYRAIRNECHSIITGRVTDTTGLAELLSSSEMSTAELDNRLHSLPLDKWLFAPASTRATATTASPELIADLPLPPGHPEATGRDAFAPKIEAEVREQITACRERTAETVGLAYDTYDRESAGMTATPTDPSPDTDTLITTLQTTGFMSTLPLVDSLPGNATYDADTGALVCDSCGATRSPTFDGLLGTLACHGSLADIDRDQVPPVELGLTLSPEQIATASIEPRLLCALQIIANIAHKQYTRYEIDLVHDSPSDILQLFGIDSNDIHTLKRNELITLDKLHGYSYYTVTPTGRDLLNAPHRKTVEWGHTKGDNTETLLHIVMVEALRRLAIQEYVDDPSSPIIEVIPYFELTASDDDYGLDAGTRFDLVGLDAEDRIRLIGEAERSNNDRATAAFRDYDKIATVEPDEALWIVPTSSKGHEAVLQPLGDPNDDTREPRIPQYSEESRISQIRGVSEPGMTDIYTLNEIRKQLAAPTLSPDLL